MDLELDSDLLRSLDEAAVEELLALEVGTPEFEDAFWLAMTPAGLPSAPTTNAWVWFAGLPQALSLKALRLVALRRPLTALATAAIRHGAAAVAAELAMVLAAAARRSPADPVRSTAGPGRVAAVLNPRLSRPNPFLA
ncbi:hypothetical protein GALL_312080 [mine drainage metagenome]|uniref:Uncharacterized protein n=1 Tax=mine drainage metagenome TaxID=410659 RepID=A0A1J5RFQ1_9ZZZZ